jgi:protein TonB
MIEKSPPVTPNTPAHLSKKLQIQVCPTKFESHPELDGVYKVGDGIKPPRPLNSVLANFPDKARKMMKKEHLSNFQAISVLSFVVNAQGNPADICVQKPAGYGMDEEAVKAAEQYRFQPATKEDGTPVATRISLEVNFRTY